MSRTSYAVESRTFYAKLGDLHWLLMIVLAGIGVVGVALLFSVGGDGTEQLPGSWRPWAYNHAMRLVLGLGVMVAFALIDIRFWLQIAYPVYGMVLLLLVGVELFGEQRMGAQRWLSIGPITMQPSELMKLALVLALARFFHDKPVRDVSHLFTVGGAVLMMGAPVALVGMQPDLGTAVLIGATGAAVLFVAGIGWRWISFAAVSGVGLGYVMWNHGLHDYQRQRILTFLNPEADPLGAGFHTLQSRIALGAGGLEGAGFTKGTQTHFDFLPEKHTDFILPVLGEEFGFLGVVGLLSLYAAVLVIGLRIAMNSKSHFGRLTAVGVLTTFASYVVINTAMVTGMAPVVGVPMPLVSYGGTVILSTFAAFGVLMSIHIHRDILVGGAR